MWNLMAAIWIKGANGSEQWMLFSVTASARAASVSERYGGA